MTSSCHGNCQISPGSPHETDVHLLAVLNNPLYFNWMRWCVMNGWRLVCWYYTTLQWLHNGRGSISNYQPHDCLLNRWFRRRYKKHQSSASLAFVRGIHRGQVNSPHKWPVTRKMFPLDDVIMSNGTLRERTMDLRLQFQYRKNNFASQHSL